MRSLILDAWTLRAGRAASPAAAPTIARAAETPIAGANPSVNACADAKLPAPANTAARIAIPNTPPSSRSVLNVPAALPMLVGHGAQDGVLRGGDCHRNAAPATISGATSSP